LILNFVNNGDPLEAGYKTKRAEVPKGL